MTALFAKIPSRLSVNAIHAAILLCIFAGALALRIFPPYDSVFMDGWIRFWENDPWYHLRVIENLVQHFPWRITYDPFTLFPYGQHAPFAPFFDLMLGFFIWVIGLGSPTQHTIEVVAAYFPAVLGALITIPVYFIGKEVFNRNAGLISAGLTAILPGEFLFRSLLGFTDHHVAEVLFSTLVALFLILAIKSARGKQAFFDLIWHRDWKTLKRPLIYAILTGLMLGMYLLSWVGALLFVFTLFVYIALQFVIDHVRSQSTDYLCVVGLPPFLITLLMVAPFSYPPYPGKGMVIAALVIGTLGIIALSALSRLMTRMKLKPGYYPVAMVALGLAGLGLLYAVQPALFESMLARFAIFTPSLATRTISEAQPILFQQGSFTLKFAWYYFTTGFYIALLALALLVYTAFKDKSAEKTLIVVWTLIMLAATFGQRRFGYYYAVNIAVLCGWLSWTVLQWSIRRTWGTASQSQTATFDRKRDPRKGKKDVKKKGETRPVGGYFKYILPAITTLAIFFAVFYPNIGEAMATAQRFSGTNQIWYNALVWMRYNTPDPFLNPNFYYQLYEYPPSGERYEYPPSAYGVMSWWDYGHWITRIARRIPHTNPFQAGVGGASRFFTAQHETAGNEILNPLGTKYVIIDYLMVTSKFYAIPVWIGLDESQYYDTYYEKTTTGQLRARRMYHAEYYQCMCVRLFNFGGDEWNPDEWLSQHGDDPNNLIWVISFDEMEVKDAEGHRLTVKVITDKQLFASYSEAQEFVSSNPGYIIAGTDRFVSPVPLEKLEHYTLVYHSPEVIRTFENQTVPYLQIFEYVP